MARAAREMKSLILAPAWYWFLEPNRNKKLPLFLDPPEGFPALSEMNGCGGDGFGWLVPESWLCLDVSRACLIHDFCYTLLAFERAPFLAIPGWEDYSIRYRVDNRADADALFRRNLLALERQANSPWWARALRRPLINLAWLGVRLGGWRHI
jgi:hypothetical protein